MPFIVRPEFLIARRTVEGDGWQLRAFAVRHMLYRWLDVFNCEGHSFTVFFFKEVNCVPASVAVSTWFNYFGTYLSFTTPAIALD